MVSQRNPCFVLVFFLLCQNIDGQARAQNKTPCENCLLACKESSRPNAPLQSKKIGLIICESCVHNTTVCPVQELSRILFKYWKTESKPSLLVSRRMVNYRFISGLRTELNSLGSQNHFGLSGPHTFLNSQKEVIN